MPEHFCPTRPKLKSRMVLFLSLFLYFSCEWSFIEKNESIFCEILEEKFDWDTHLSKSDGSQTQLRFFPVQNLPKFFSGLIRKWTTSEVHSFVHNSSQTWNFKGKTFSLLDTTESESSSPCDWSRLIATEWHELITCYDAPIFKHTCSSQESFHQSFIFLNDGSRRKIVLLLLGSIGLTGHGPRYQSQVVRAVPCRARWFVFDSSSINACRYFGGV